MEGVFKRNRRSSTRISKTERAGITFSVPRVHHQLRTGRYARRIRIYSSVYLAVMLEYLVCEILELAGKEAALEKRKRITPRHIMLAIRKDEELNDLLKGVTISFSGVVPNIQQAPLLPNKK